MLRLGPNINPDAVRSDLSLLQAAAKQCEDYTDKRIAHRDKREPNVIPTYTEVDECVDLLEKLYIKYLLLFCQTSMDTVLPIWQYDWTEIFRVPWIDG